LHDGAFRDEPNHAVLLRDLAKVPIFDLQSLLHRLNLLEGTRGRDGSRRVVGENAEDVETGGRNRDTQEDAEHAEQLTAAYQRLAGKTEDSFGGDPVPVFDLRVIGRIVDDHR
jgi:hypothetical protein